MSAMLTRPGVSDAPVAREVHRREGPTLDRNHARLLGETNLVMTKLGLIKTGFFQFVKGPESSP